ncbi:MAG: L,D-transpeptidase family protein [Clostridiaceae bacterium]|nr:L,D-transpeptidase family protein [Clostridiaceae bacterium]
MHRRTFLILLLVLIILFNPVCSSIITATPASNNSTLYFTVLVDLNESRLFLIKNSSGKIVKEFPIAGGKYYTPSPIGTWRIYEKAKWSKGFGTRWIGLNVPWGKYGIHGTNKPLSIGSAASRGCIRMLNKDVELLFSIVPIGTLVIIYGGPYDLNFNTFRLLIPGDRGADVLEVQIRLKNIHYYEGNLNGIYDEEMKKDVIKFRRDKKLPISHEIDSQFYHALNIYPFE